MPGRPRGTPGELTGGLGAPPAGAPEGGGDDEDAEAFRAPTEPTTLDEDDLARACDDDGLM